MADKSAATYHPHNTLEEAQRAAFEAGLVRLYLEARLQDHETDKEN
jgi:hypothetical protein